MQTGSGKIKENSLLSKWLNREKEIEKPQGILPRPEGINVPLSMGQQRLLFLQQLYPENPFYHYADAYKFKGKLDLSKFIEAFEDVGERHEILRTTISNENGQAFQKVNNKKFFEFSEHDLRNSSEEDVKENLKNLAVAEARKPFNLNEGPLTRLSVFRLRDEEYLIVLTMHHIITDKWSMGILRDELAENYQKLCKGESLKAEPLEIQYADYAYWQSRQKINSQNLSFWKNKLENSLHYLELPNDFPRPQRPTFRGAYLKKEFSSELSAKLNELCRKTNKTLYTVLLTAYKILLHKYSGETDILVGSPFTNRDKVELEKIIGFFNDTLVLRSDLSDNPTFAELLEDVWKTTQDAFAHKEMPFEMLVKNLKPERYLNYNPLFQVMFIYHDVPKNPDFGENLQIEYEPFDFGVTKFDLTLYISEEDENVTAIFEYSKDLFEEKTIQRMHVHLNNLLKGIVENPNRNISEFSIISGKEKDLTSSWNKTKSTNREVESFLELFEKQVEKNPKKTAVSFQGKALSYRELDEKANLVANYLLGLEPEANKPVALFVEPKPEMIIGILGILKAGLPYLPLDAEYPKDRIEYILQDSGATIILTNTQLFYFVQDKSIQTQTFEEIFSKQSVEKVNFAKPLGCKCLAYVIYTSGSTGKPKGVAISHKNLFHSTVARFDYYEKKPTSFLLLSSFSFDSSVAGIFWTLATGGKLVLTERRIEQDLEAFSDILVSEKITHTLLLPTLYSTLLKNIAKEKFESFETVIVAGEACPNSLVKEHFESLPNVKLYNEYGPTETTVWATAHEIKVADSVGKVPIGKAISNTQIYILDEYQKPVPIGVKGEMYIGGKGVAQGYFNDDELTAKRFVDNSFSESSSSKLYRTGDLCRYRKDGSIEFLGRIDSQIKLRGFRIEPEDITRTLKQNPDIKEATVKIESVNHDNSEVGETDLLKGLNSMNTEEADEFLTAIEKLSEKEVEFMLNELE